MPRTIKSSLSCWLMDWLWVGKVTEQRWITIHESGERHRDPSVSVLVYVRSNRCYVNCGSWNVAQMCKRSKWKWKWAERPTSSHPKKCNSICKWNMSVVTALHVILRQTSLKWDCVLQVLGRGSVLHRAEWRWKIKLGVIFQTQIHDEIDAVLKENLCIPQISYCWSKL